MKCSVFTGYAGVVRYGPLKVAGLSGIYKAKDYAKGMFYSFLKACIIFLFLLYFLLTHSTFKDSIYTWC